MQYTIVLSALAALAAAAPAPMPQAGGVSAPVQTFTSGVVVDNQGLVPQFDVTPNTNPDGTGNCQGSTSAPIPCFCPPSRDDFINRMQQFINEGSALGAPLSFPTDDSVGSQIARLQAGIVTLQSQNDTTLGVGCPSGATTFTQQIAALSGQPATGSG